MEYNEKNRILKVFMQKINYEVTDSAINRVAYLIKNQKNPVNALRVSIMPGGCNGMQYKYELTDKIHEEDLVFEKNGVKVVVDELSAGFIQNGQIDYVEELGAAYFQIKNPNASSKCGCGSSFGI